MTPFLQIADKWTLEHDGTAICCGGQTLMRVYYGEGRTYEDSLAVGTVASAAPELLRELNHVIDSLDPAMARCDIVSLRERLLRFLDEKGLVK